MKTGDVIHGYRLIQRLDQGGSDRKFFRCTKNNTNYILVFDNELAQYLKLQKHLQEKDVGVPRVYWHDLAARLMVQEDLGDTSLFALSKAGEYSAESYRMALDELLKLQIDGRQGVPLHLYYDGEHIRWEQHYFRDHFLVQHCGFQARDLQGLEADFGAIMRQLLETARSISDYLMHRDFQSQNIYLKDEQVRIIDFQSARIGPLTYDLAALLRDAYVNIDIETENRLVEYYYSRLCEQRIRIAKDKFIAIYELTCLQRNMQALGAFANLSLNKGKPQFAQYIPRGMALLRRGLEGKDFTRLRNIIFSVTP